MSTDFKLPEVAEGVESADIAEILVAEGDVIDADQVVMEIETEKAVVELPCPHAGRVAKIHVSEGDSVPIGTVLLTIDADGKGGGEKPARAKEAKADKKPEPEKKKEPEKKREPEEAKAAAKPAVKAEEKRETKPAEKAEAPKREEKPAPAKEAPRAREVAGEEDEPSPTAPATAMIRAGEDVPAEAGSPPPAGPATRRLARELGVDLRRVTGSGPGGRITSEDVQTFVRSLTSGTAAGGIAPMGAPTLPDFSRYGPIERQPLNKIARTAAANLSVAWQVVPHVTQHDLADITELEQSRRKFMESAKGGPKITVTAILIKAVVAALKEFPHFNSSLDYARGELILKGYYHIGVAVDTEFGLLVPTIRDADRKTVVQIAAELEDIAQRARNRKLEISEMQGATFTITNLGGIGGTFFTPILNYPEVAILGVSRTQTQLTMRNGQPVERLMLPLSLSYDHRVVNGADAARFIVKLSRTLSDYFQLLIEC